RGSRGRRPRSRRRFESAKRRESSIDRRRRARRRRWIEGAASRRVKLPALARTRGGDRTERVGKEREPSIDANLLVERIDEDDDRPVARRVCEETKPCAIPRIERAE